MIVDNDSKALDRIYEAAFVPELWPGILHDMAQSIEAEGTLLFCARKGTNQSLVSEDIAELVNSFNVEGWAQCNSRAARLLQNSSRGFVSDFDLFTEDEMLAQPMYVDFLRPKGFGWGAATIIHMPSGDDLIFSMEKRYIKGPVDRSALDYLDALGPHLARAAFLSSRLEFERITAAVEALQMAGLRSAVLGFDGKVLASNSLLEEFTTQVRLGASDRVIFAHRPANVLLAEAIKAAGDSSGRRALSSRSFPLPQSGDAPAAIVHLIPVRGKARDIFTRAAFLLIVTPVDRTRVPAAETIQGLFDLSPAEARIARCLAAGGNVAAVARQLCLSPETVRSHIKSILSKSGTARQTDFVAAIASIHSPDLEREPPSTIGS